MYTQYGVREICDVVFKAKANMTVGNKKFFKGEPVIYFDALKTSTLEGAATTVYATGGRGNSRLIAWEGERTVTFTMEDALISPVGFMLLSGAGLIEAYDGRGQEVGVRQEESVEGNGEQEFEFDLNHAPSGVVKVSMIPAGGIVTSSKLTTGDIAIDGNTIFVSIENNEVIVADTKVAGRVQYKYEVSGELTATEMFDALAYGNNKYEPGTTEFPFTLQHEPIGDITVTGGMIGGNQQTLQEQFDSIIINETDRKQITIKFKQGQTATINMALQYTYIGTEQKQVTENIEAIADTNSQPSVEFELEHTPIEDTVKIIELETDIESNVITVTGAQVSGNTVIVTTEKPVNEPANVIIDYKYYQDGNAANAKVIYQHIAETVSKDKYNEDDEFEVSEIVASQEQANGALIYIMPLKNGKMFTEPYLGRGDGISKKVAFAQIYTVIDGTETITYQNEDWEEDFAAADAFLIDYYTPRYENAMQIDITPDSFGGNFYIEASTLFRNTDGVDYPAEFIIPNAKIQSNFTFNMASSGDPSTFTFTCDAFPDYTRFNRTKKVIAALQVITAANSEDKYREATATSLSF